MHGMQLTYVAICVSSFGALAHIADGTNVFLLEAALVVQDGDTVSLNHEGQRGPLRVVLRVAVVIGILNIKDNDLQTLLGLPDGWLPD